MKSTFLVITSIANDAHPVLKLYASTAPDHGVPLVVIGDTKSPKQFDLRGCDFYGIDRQRSLPFKLAEKLPVRHYARKNIGYLIAMRGNADVIVETDDDNLPLRGFWEERQRIKKARIIEAAGWLNVYRYFSEALIWPRGFALEEIHKPNPALPPATEIACPIQQGLADENPDVDAIYRLTLPLPIVFNDIDAIALAPQVICPFNSQNTTWFKEAFPLLYLPSYCSFRMTDIWRSFVAQRVAWSCGWAILFHKSTVRQDRNDHNLMTDFKDEICGYINNLEIMNALGGLQLKEGVQNISSNMIICYERLIQMGIIGAEESELLQAWLDDVSLSIQ